MQRFELIIPVLLLLLPTSVWSVADPGEFAIVLSSKELNSQPLSHTLQGAHAHPASPCQPLLTCEHVKVYCLDEATGKALPKPKAQSPCGAAILSLDSEERYDDLDCSAGGFSGYFDPSRWQMSARSGDGGVDVTGAPNALLAEGANEALVNVAPDQTTWMAIAIPADGFVTFDWRNVGGSNLFPSEFSVAVNGVEEPAARQAATRGIYRSPALRQGDQLAFHLTSDRELGLLLSNFQFYTSASGVVQRTWTARDDQGRAAAFTQLIAVEKPNMTDIVFPVNRDGLAAPAWPSHAVPSPEESGFPIIDRDGDLDTTHDQYILKDGNCHFHVRYFDQIGEYGDACVIARRWVVTDWCGNNTAEYTQIIKLSGKASAKGCPAEHTSETPANPAGEIISNRPGALRGAPSQTTKANENPMTF
jgi:hypothetical protein